MFCSGIFSLDFPVFFGVAAITVGIGFIFHEMGHKFLAQKYRCWAEFRSFDAMLGLAVLMSLVGFIFAAPGAVMISGTVTRDRNGKISAAGPMMNIILALVFLGIGFLIPGLAENHIGASIVSYGFFINSFLALFNMIPVGNFDGSKILRWNKVVYGGMVVGALALVLLAF